MRFSGSFGLTANRTSRDEVLNLLTESGPPESPLDKEAGVGNPRVTSKTGGMALVQVWT